MAFEELEKRLCFELQALPLQGGLAWRHAACLEYSVAVCDVVGLYAEIIPEAFLVDKRQDCPDASQKGVGICENVVCARGYGIRRRAAAVSRMGYNGKL